MKRSNRKLACVAGLAFWTACGSKEPATIAQSLLDGGAPLVPALVTTELTYRSDDVLLRRRTAAGDNTLSEQTYTLTPAGRIVSKTVTPSSQRSSHYTYDGLGRLRCANGSATDPCPGVTAPAGAAPAGSQIVVSYNDRQDVKAAVAYVNPARAGQTVDTYSHGSTIHWSYLSDRINQISSTGGPCADGSTTCTGTITFGYDAHSARRTENDSRFPTGATPQREFTYGADRQLREVTVRAPVSATGPDCGTVTYQARKRTLLRDASGQIAHSARYDGSSTTAASSDTFHRLPNGDISYRIRYADLQGHPTEYTTYKHLYLEGERVAMVKAKYRDGERTSREYVFVQSDHLGVPVSAITTSTLATQGEVSWRGDPDAWGWPHDVTPDPDRDHITGFPGQLHLDDTQVEVFVNNGGTCTRTTLRPRIADNWFRAYDPYTGAYLQPDPAYGVGILGLPPEASAYAYVGGNPLMYVDPWGLHESHWMLRLFIPGQVFWDEALTAFESGNNAEGVAGLGGVLGEAVLTGVTFGGYAVARTMCKTAATAATRGRPGSYTPNRTLPWDKQGVPIPDSLYPHTQLGRSKPKYGAEPQAREWDYGSNGRLQPKRDIDFTDHGYPNVHPNPHQHPLTPNNPTLAPKGGYQRGPHEPL